MNRPISRVVLTLLFLTGCAGTVFAAEITIVNPSFEEPALPNDLDFVGGSIPGWTLIGGGAGGAFNPDSTYQEAYDGNSVLWINGGHKMVQTLADTALAGTYTLEVYVNHRVRPDGHIGPNSYDVELLVDGVSVPATTKVLPVTLGTSWQLATATFNFADGDPRLGGQLGIRFSNYNVTDPAPRQQHFDAVSLSYVPEPATASLLVLGGLALLRRRR